MIDSPFRWNITNQRYLGSLVEGEQATTYDCFLNQLLECCARVLAFADDSDLIFVGRSPESIFDHLNGLLYDTSWSRRLELLQKERRGELIALLAKEDAMKIPLVPSTGSRDSVLVCL